MDHLLDHYGPHIVQTHNEQRLGDRSVFRR